MQILQTIVNELINYYTPYDEPANSLL